LAAGNQSWGSAVNAGVGGAAAATVYFMRLRKHRPIISRPQHHCYAFEFDTQADCDKFIALVKRIALPRLAGTYLMLLTASHILMNIRVHA
jgi:hypothetical protein